MSYSFLGQTITLLLLNGNKIEIKLEEDVLNFQGGDLLNDYRIGDLRQYIFENWDALLVESQQHNFETLDRSNSKPEQPDQLQLLYLGSRLNPNGYLSSLNLGLSAVFHLMIRPLDLLNQQQNLLNNTEKKGFNFKLGGSRRRSSSTGNVQNNNGTIIPGVNQALNITTIPSNRRGSSSNAPVPAFIPNPTTEQSEASTPISNTNNGSSFVRERSEIKDDVEDEEEVSLANSGISPRNIEKSMDNTQVLTDNNNNTTQITNNDNNGTANGSKLIHSHSGRSANNGRLTAITNSDGDITQSNSITHNNTTPSSGGCCIIV